MSEHLDGCNRLTTDGMLAKLDDLLWNHENSYLYEADEFELSLVREFAPAMRRDMRQVRREERRKKIKRRQKRAAFRRRKRGII